MSAWKGTPGPWEVYRHPIAGRGDAILELVEQVQSTEPLADALYLINANGKCPAITGCGPTSEANAKGIRAVPQMVEALIVSRNRFLEYEHLHNCAQKWDKAKRNREMVDLCDEALKAAGALDA